MGAFVKTEVYMNKPLIERLKAFMENETHSCSMDFGCITPLYVYRMWGGNASLKEIERAMEDVRSKKEDVTSTITKKINNKYGLDIRSYSNCAPCSGANILPHC